MGILKLNWKRRHNYLSVFKLASHCEVYKVQNKILMSIYMLYICCN